MKKKWLAHLRNKVTRERAAGLRQPTLRDVSVISWCPFTRRRCNLNCLGATCSRFPFF